MNTVERMDKFLYKRKYEESLTTIAGLERDYRELAEKYKVAQRLVSGLKCMCPIPAHQSYGCPVHGFKGSYYMERGE